MNVGQPSGQSCVTVSGVGRPLPSCPLDRPRGDTATTTIDDSKIRAAIDAAAFRAAGIKARDEQAFVTDSSVWPTPRVAITDREAMWQRKEMSASLRGVGASSLPPAAKGFQLTFDKPLVQRRTGVAAGCRTRPSIYDYVVSGSNGYAINFAASAPMQSIQEHGLGSVPCGNPDCVGSRAGKWHTSPCRWGHATAGPSIHIEANGMPAPVDYAWSMCETCKVPFSHGNPVTLRRLRDVPDVLDMLPYDPEWPWGSISLARTHTSDLEYDVVSRQGVIDVIAKVAKKGSEWIQRRVERYMDHGQVWASQLSDVVGDHVWEQLTPQLQLELAELRGEYEFFSATHEALAPLGEGLGRTDPMRWNVPDLGRGVLLEKMLAVFENRRDHREGQMSCVPIGEVLSVDWCVHTGVQLGGGRLANFCNEDNNLVRSQVTKTESIEGLTSVLEDLALVASELRVVVFDKVPPSLDETAISKLEQIIMNKLPTVIKVMQDRFHVCHNLSKYFNNCHALFASLICIGFRDSTVFRDPACEGLIDEALQAGLIAKSCKHKTIALGQKLSKAEIDELKDSGLYHNLFSSKRRVIVPENVKDAATLKLAIPRWAEMVIDGSFLPADAAGVRHPILINGKRLAASPEFVRKHATNALKRMLKCIPPPGMPAWRNTGEQDANGFIIWKSRFHTCGVESWNALQPDFNTGAAGSKELVQGCFLEGNAKRIVAKQVELGQQEDLANVWDLRRAVNINRLAGHGAGTNMMARLTRISPVKVIAPPPKPPTTVCMSNLWDGSTGVPSSSCQRRRHSSSRAVHHKPWQLCPQPPYWPYRSSPRSPCRPCRGRRR